MDKKAKKRLQIVNQRLQTLRQQLAVQSSRPTIRRRSGLSNGKWPKRKWKSLN